jgi:uncharacterized SAM-binding protein YcdF (DUF218 family)
MSWRHLAQVVVCGWSMMACCLDIYGARHVVSLPTDLIVVAGCRVTSDGQASPCLAHRVERAVALWKAGGAPRILMTGGVGEHPPAESQVARAYARDLGVPLAAIMVEDRSTSTSENALFGAQSTDLARVVLVTDTYHVFRASRVFRHHFEHVQAVGVRTSTWPRILGSMREVAAVVWYGATGRL